MSPVTFGQKLGAGIFIFLAVSCWAFFNITLSNKEVGKKYVVYFSESVRGLAPSSLVCYNGIPVGKVAKLTNNLQNNSVKVDIIITDPDITVFKLEQGNNGFQTEEKKGTQAKLVTYMMTGLQYIDLSGIGEKELQEGKTIPTSEDNMVKRLELQFTSISEQVKRITDRLDELASPQNLENISSIIANIEMVSANIAMATSTQEPEGIPFRLNKVLENVENLSGENSEFEKILKNLAEITDPEKIGLDLVMADVRTAIQRLDKSITILLYNVNQLVDSKGKKEDLTKTMIEVNNLLRQNKDNINQLTSNLATLSKTTNDKLAKLSDGAQKTVDTFNHFLQKELYQTTSNMNLMLAELTNLIQILKAKPNALLWGSEVQGQK